MHAHIKAGWTYGEHVGCEGGWEHDNDSGLLAVACRSGRKWQAFVTRFDDGATLYHTEHRTRDEAMRAAMSARESDVTRRAGVSVPFAATVVVE